MIKLIEVTCKRFLWTGGVELTKKAILAWDKVCYPTSAGRLNILDIVVWNRATISKLLFKIYSKKNKLWVQWVHSYYIKGGQVWGVISKQASRMVQKIMKIQSYVQQARISEEDLQSKPTFSIKNMYVLMRGDFPKVHLRRLVCNNFGAPK